MAIQIKRMTWDEIPDLEREAESMIEQRCAKAKGAVLSAYRDLAGTGVDEDVKDSITDLLSDLRHLCDALGLDFAEHDRIAYRHYVEEKHDPHGDPCTETGEGDTNE